MYQVKALLQYLERRDNIRHKFFIEESSIHEHFKEKVEKLHKR